MLNGNIICICGKSLKTKQGFVQHGKKCLKQQKDILSGGTGQPPVPDTVDVARDELRNDILPSAIKTLRNTLNGVPTKESIIRAAVAVIKLTGADKPKLQAAKEITINFGEDPDNQFEPEDLEDGDKSEPGSVAETSIAV